MTIFDITRIEIDARVGTDIKEVITEAIELARKYGCEVFFSFNDVSVLVSYYSNVDDVVNEYRKLSPTSKV